jgi:hypothetical protein
MGTTCPPPTRAMVVVGRLSGRPTPADGLEAGGVAEEAGLGFAPPRGADGRTGSEVVDWPAAGDELVDGVACSREAAVPEAGRGARAEADAVGAAGGTVPAGAGFCTGLSTCAAAGFAAPGKTRANRSSPTVRGGDAGAGPVESERLSVGLRLSSINGNPPWCRELGENWSRAENRTAGRTRWCGLSSVWVWQSIRPRCDLLSPRRPGGTSVPTARNTRRFGCLTASDCASPRSRVGLQTIPHTLDVEQTGVDR